MSSAGAVSAAVAIAADHGVRVDDPVVLKDSFSVRVHLRPAPIVARVPTVTTFGRPRPVDALAREVAVVSFLTKRGAPVVPVSDLLPPGPFERYGYAVTFWAYAEHDRDRQLKPVDVGRALADLHAVLRDYPGELPYLGPALEETTFLLDRLDARAHPDRGTLAELREELDLLRAESRRWPGPVQAVHGDAHAGNLLATPEGPLWIDFEETCSGPVGWDLACMLGSGRFPGRRAVQDYGVDPDDRDLQPFLRARRLQGALWMLAKTLSFPEETPRALAALDDWRRNRG
ncbi:aminoglycoside phosphotransferase family protein [Streptosporangium saharense]|uniref:Aminoglycoside phosphotransferase (APT) family kinase protein n=1 Tax=Streptosporangium saharense TaxID=1706840 RepID=A0A7W7QNZ2_9ACTN|nr:aminoglycoside phosphotransferase family protein [Streptosporangium saharense]MBB4916954.1 aminoglycoside phosphotransferase (APT) family kinase protein [Streptosporangium saharense]